MRMLKDKLDHQLYMHGGIPFQRGSCDLKPQGREALMSLVPHLQAHNLLGLKVYCMTGNQGDEYEARQLSQDRANEVKRYLRECNAPCSDPALAHQIQAGFYFEFAIDATGTPQAQ